MAHCGQHLAEKFPMLLRFLYMPLFLASSAAFLVEYPIIICKRSLDDILLCTQTLGSCSRNEEIITNWPTPVREDVVVSPKLALGYH